MPFAVAEDAGILTLTLDTPGSRVNIFNHATAVQLTDVLARVTPANTRAIVFETAKPGSFLNGVGLLLAHASQTPDDVVRASEPSWAAYRAVREAPVPTIAVVQGSCFGCGVEFALSCDYRIASDGGETRFYMTELSDYLFIPLFGSTWNLPDAVGLADAIDLLLWGERWDAARACARGLVDAVAPAHAVAPVRDGFLRDVLAGAGRSRRRGRVTWGVDEDRAMARARQRIAALPPPYQGVYGDALALLAAGARQEGDYVAHQRRELERAAASALAPIGKAAYAFFYLRQMAGERAAGRGAGDGAPVTLAVAVEAGSPERAFVDGIAARPLSGVAFAGDSPADVRLVSPGGNGDGARVAVRVRLADGPCDAVELYAPWGLEGGRLIELAARNGHGQAVDAAGLARTLQRGGFEVARTAPDGPFVTTSLLVAWLGPLVRYVATGGEAAAVNGALRALGVVRRPHDLLAALAAPAIAGQLARGLALDQGDVARALAALAAEAWTETADQTLLHDALCVSLLDAVLRARATGAVRDTTVADLIAREVLDFPRHLVSLCAWLKVGRVERALDDEARVGALVTSAALAAARDFVAAGREFYR